jgi:hypothetical protein
MTLTIGAWAIPAILTVVAIFWPFDKAGDTYGIGSLMELALKVPVILFVWLVFFALSYFFS